MFMNTLVSYSKKFQYVQCNSVLTVSILMIIISQWLQPVGLLTVRSRKYSPGITVIMVLSGVVSLPGSHYPISTRCEVGSSELFSEHPGLNTTSKLKTIKRSSNINSLSCCHPLWEVVRHRKVRSTDRFCLDLAFSKKVSTSIGI